MSVTSAPWLAYLPPDVAADLVQHPDHPTGRARRAAAVALFADVSGFTAMSEALAASGARGAEELTSILNDYFTTMLTVVARYGGVVGKFGGDAVTVLFPLRVGRQAVAARRALRCALDMQASMSRFQALETSVGRYGLTMKAGVAVGQVVQINVGDPATRLEYIIAGSALDGCAEAEHHAGRGEVVAQHAALAGVADAQIAEQRGGFALLAGLGAPVRPAPLPPPPAPPPEIAPVLAAFLHPSLSDRLRAGRAAFVNEHRRVTTLFVAFSELDYDTDPAAPQRLHRYLDSVIATIARYDGYLNKVDMGDKGSKFVVLFGAPTAHEDDERRAVHCALALLAVSAAQNPPFAARVGVNAGRVYCGDVGGPERREYTVMGDPVNLAARLMQAAQPGQVLVSSATAEVAGAGFVWQPLEPLRVKGKSEPVAVTLAVGVAAAAGHAEPQRTSPLVGRAAELALAERLLAEAAEGHGRVIGLVGAAGVGKSRLAAEIARRAAAHGFLELRGAAQAYGAASSYLVWQGVWRGLFGLADGVQPELALERVTAALATIDPALARRAPLLGPTLGLELPDNPLTAGLEPQLRAELLRGSILAYLRGRRGPPLLIVLDDIHWIDQLSQELLVFLGRNLGELPIALLAVQRPPDSAADPLAWAARASHARTIALHELDEAEARALLARRLGLDASNDAALLARLVDRAQGNPFYLEELTNLIRDRQIDLRATDPAAIELPDSLQQLIMSRIDQLDDRARTTIKVASVIGRQFRANWVWGAYPAVGDAAETLAALERLSQLDLTPLVSAAREPEYLFRHITTQEVAYSSLSFALRAELHAAVGNYIEHSYAGGLPPYYDQLAYHYGLTGRADKQQVYFRLAGDAARADYANAAALGHYERLLPLLPEAEQGAVLVDIGEVLQLTGAWPASEQRYRQALAIGSKHADARLLARARCQIGSLLGHTSSFEAAIGWLDQAHADFVALDDQRGVCHALEYASFINIQLGRYETALAQSTQQLALAEQLGDQALAAAALGYLGLASWRRGQLAEAQGHLERAQQAALAAGNRRSAALVGSDLAGLRWSQGDNAGALTELAQAVTIAAEIGYQQAVGFMTGNAGVVYLNVGAFEQALNCLTVALQAALDLGDQGNITLWTTNIAYVWALNGALAQAVALLRQIVAAAGHAERPYQRAADLFQLGQFEEQLGALEAALEHNAAALELGQAVERQDIMVRAGAAAALLQARAGRVSTAQAADQIAAQLAAAEADEELLAFVHWTRWRLDGDPAAALAAAELYRAIHAASANQEARARFAELTGSTLPAPPPLPSFPTQPLAPGIDLAALLARR